MRHVLTLISALFLLSACDSTESLVALKHSTPASDPYQAALASGYQQFAEEKIVTYQWWTSKYFADKGLLAAYGRDVLPEDPAQWEDIAKAPRKELTNAREQLLAVLPNARAAKPAAAGATVLAYDRWIVLADNGWDTARIDEARDLFFTKLGQLQGLSAPEATLAPPTESTSTILYFPFDSAVLSGSAKLAMQQLVDYVKAAGNIGIVINGHADRAGSDEYNMKLSENRARFIEQALREVGVPENQVRYFAFGESDPDVPTDDGVKEPLNRRVEIFIE